MQIIVKNYLKIHYFEEGYKRNINFFCIFFFELYFSTGVKVVFSILAVKIAFKFIFFTIYTVLRNCIFRRVKCNVAPKRKKILH